MGLLPSSLLGVNQVKMTAAYCSQAEPQTCFSLDGTGEKTGAPFYRSAIPSSLRKLSTECRKTKRQSEAFCLSRAAAGDALWRLGAVGSREVFPRSLAEVPELCGHTTKLSLSHEDAAAGAVAWHVDGDGGRDIRLALDIVDVISVHRFQSRFPQFAERMVPQCRSGFSAERLSAHGVRDLLYEKAALGDFLNLPSSSRTLSSMDALLWTGDGSPWQDPQAAASSAEILPPLYAFVWALALSQHWSVRECCVKLIGSGHSFPYGSLKTSPHFTHLSSSASPCLLPRGVLRPNQPYHSAPSSRELEAATELSSFRCTSWIDWILSSDRLWHPHVVTVAAMEVPQAVKNS